MCWYAVEIDVRGAGFEGALGLGGEGGILEILFFRTFLVNISSSFPLHLSLSSSLHPPLSCFQSHLYCSF